MRSWQVYRALDQIPNRFALCSSMSKGVRTIHKNGNSMGTTVTSAFGGVESKKASCAPVPVLMASVARALPLNVGVTDPMAILAT